MQVDPLIIKRRRKIRTKVIQIKKIKILSKNQKVEVEAKEKLLFQNSKIKVNSSLILKLSLRY